MNIEAGGHSNINLNFTFDEIESVGNVNAIDDGFDGVRAVWDMESESYRVAVQSRAPGLVSTKW